MSEDMTLAGKRFVMYVIGFVFNLSSAIPTYVNSTFLAKFTSARYVGIIYTASSLLALLVFVEMAGTLRKFGNFKTTLGLLFVELLSLAGLATGQSALVIISSFLINFVAIALINFTIDLFLEEFSTNRWTGRIRGTFLATANLAWLISPLLASWILGDNLYGNMYAVSGILLLPVILLVFFALREVKEPTYERITFWKSFAVIWADRDIKGILFIQFLLQFFYAWMIIYTPIYLHQFLGFGWSTLGIVFTVMLAPFVMVEWPLGRAADWIGEKKWLAIGFAIMGISTLAIVFVTDHVIWVWAALLFVTRIGAAMVEVMSDTYFFKQIDASNTHALTFARMARPLAYVISPIIATVLFFFFDIRGLFIFLGFLMFYGIRYVVTLKETAKVPA